MVQQSWMSLAAMTLSLLTLRFLHLRCKLLHALFVFDALQACSQSSERFVLYG